MNESTQLELLRNIFPKFRGKYAQFPTTSAANGNPFYVYNRPFGRVDALVAHCMVRHFQPRSIVEVGSGFSSLILGRAAEKKQNVGPHLHRSISARLCSQGIYRVANVD
jgi:hypothetical protein